MQAQLGVEGEESAPVPEQQLLRRLRFKFTGNAREYFRIWIVNTLLTIVTLGVYSAWARVRTKQYFYRHTRLNGSSFDYLGDPRVILKGHIIAAAIGGVLLATQYYSRPLYLAAAAVLALLLPWLMLKAWAFNAHNSTYRNIRFAFTAKVGESYREYLKVLLWLVLTCGAAQPYARWRLTKFALSRFRYGNVQPSWSTRPGEYFKTYLLGLGLVLPLYAVLLYAIVRTMKHEADLSSWRLWVATALFNLVLLVPFSFVKARLTNHLLGGIGFNQHRLISKQKGLALLRLYAVNLLAITLSAGLLIPWAMVRLARYRAESLRLLAAGPLFVRAGAQKEPTAVAEGFVDVGGFDVDFGW